MILCEYLGEPCSLEAGAWDGDQWIIDILSRATATLIDDTPAFASIHHRMDSFIAQGLTKRYNLVIVRDDTPAFDDPEGPVLVY